MECRSFTRPSVTHDLMVTRPAWGLVMRKTTPVSTVRGYQPDLRGGRLEIRSSHVAKESLRHAV